MQEKNKPRRMTIFARRLKRVMLAGFALIAIFVIYSGLALVTQLQVTRQDIYIEGLPKEFDGFTIVQLSDLHQDIWIRSPYVKKLVKRINGIDPDLIVLTGDYISRKPSNIEPMGESLNGLKAKHGVYAVLGNHDYWVDAPQVVSALEKSEIEVLTNENRKIELDGEHIWLAGFDDLWSGNPDYEAGMHGIPVDDTCIAITHNPDTGPKLQDTGVDFLMAGHMHGGVINLPGVIKILRRIGFSQYLAGLYRLGDMQMYVSRGVGEGGYLALRINCPPELPVFVLHPAK